MRLREFLDDVAYEYWKYSNVFVYFFNGNLITLPVHKCKIGNVMLNGMPIVDFDCLSIINEWRQKSYDVKSGWIDDNNLQEYFKGYPEEIVKAINEGRQYAQLNPENTFVLQRPKEGWQRYSVPLIASCLTSLSRKELISQYTDAILNLGTRSFVHVRYGDKAKGMDMRPGVNELSAVQQLFKKAMNGFPLVVTNHLAEASVIQPDLNDLFQWDKYSEVNNDILSAGGVSGILVSGLAQDGSTFASAQISMQTVSARIEAARAEICEMMNRINQRLIEELSNDFKYNIKEVPNFGFMPLDISGTKALRESCYDLWEKGVVSTRTMMETQGYSLDKEKEYREKEAQDGTNEIMAPRDTLVVNPDSNTSDESSEDSEGPGRKTLDDDERTSDPENAIRGKMPKPSSPEGSMPSSA